MATETYSREDVRGLILAAQRLCAARELSSVIEIACSTARSLIGADGATLVLREGDQVFYAGEDAMSPLWQGQRFPASDCISGWAMSNKQSVAIANVYADSRIQHDVYSTTFVKSLVVVPVNREQPVAAIGAYWARPHATTARELELLQAVADAAVTALANSEPYRGALATRAELEQLVAEKTELLRRANEANRAKDEFLAMLGHELRNPLAPIVTAIELLKLRGHKATREVATIERQSQHLIRLVDDLLDIARVSRGKLELKRRRSELQAFVTQAIEIAAPLIERSRHVLEVVVEPDVAIDGDEFRLAQLLANLLTNAAKYTPDSGHIRVEAFTLGAEVVISVRDSGAGIPAELMPRLFAPFVQAAQSMERSQGGLGLGLALARSIAELHGGTIQGESPGIGQGSVFTVRLPIVALTPEHKSVPPDAIAHLKPVRPLRILVIDDNEDAAELLAVSLRKQGHLASVAVDPVEALAAVRKSIPEVAFMDIGLPVMDGYELAEHFRNELGSSCPVMIAVTGYGQVEDRRRSSDAGFVMHLVKPVQLATVLEALGEIAALVDRRLAIRAS